MAKTNARLEKRKRELEKRKKTEKAILKMAAEMPDDPVEGPPSATGADSCETQDEA